MSEEAEKRPRNRADMLQLEVTGQLVLPMLPTL